MEKFNNFNVYELAISQDVYYRYFSKYKSARDDFIYSGYIEILENKDKLVGLVDLDYYRVCFNIACKGMNKFVITHRYKNSQTINISTEFDDKDVGFDKFTDFHSADEHLNYQCLVDYIKKFCSIYDSDKVKIFKMFFNGSNLDEIKKQLKFSYANIKDSIISFRQDLFDYLLFNGLISNFKVEFDNIPLSYNTLASAQYDFIKKLKKSGQFDYKFYKHDYFIYKLIRKDSDFNKFASVLDIDNTRLEKIVNHKINCAKLKLYQVQQLRRSYFPNYSLSDLVNCELELC